MRYHQTLAARLLNKLVLDILPAAAASLIGGLLFTHYGLGRITEPAAQTAAASAEMMQLLRDEHGLIVTFLDAQLARERTAAENAAHRGSGEVSAEAITPAQAPAAAVAVKPVISRVRMADTTPASAPLVIAQVQQGESPGAASQIPQLLIAQTMGLKDHVVTVTHRVVSALGGISGWIGLIGDHLPGIETKSRPATDMVTAS